MDANAQEALVQEFRRATAKRTFIDEAMQAMLARHEDADVRFMAGDASALDDKLAAQRDLAATRFQAEQARTEDRLAWISWAHGLQTTGNELLAEIRDLLTKMANPPIMVLTSTPESRAADREAKQEALVRDVEALAESVFGEAAPVNEGSEAADDRDRDLGRAVRDAVSEGSEVTCKPIKTPPPSVFDVSLLAVEVATLLEIIRRGPCDGIQPAIKERLRELEFITPLYQRKVSQFAKPIYVGEIATHAGRLWALQAGLAEPS